MAEDASSGDEFDDWFIESIKLYNDLHIYELQHATQVIEWTDEKNVCVAGCEFLKKNEILQLSLPQKLYNKDSQGLCPERDFKVEHGGFSERPVYSLRHIQGTSLLVTSGPPDNSLQLWKIGAEDTDVIGLIGSIENRVMENIWSRISVSKMMSSRVLHGSRVNNIQVTDIESKMELYKLGFDGTVHVYDTSSWNAAEKEVQPLFIHKGHSFSDRGDEAEIPLVTTHTWCPWKPRTILSAATDGSFHVWDWADFHTS
ncbi:WD repeat-containing protein 73 isoform X2 [Protopterus annectens]|uniref:WD repeat-containing protein 73 isoform X2 n=1 Tax=Protopterus annectens TaxID=7888 RepID=UPI001CFB76B4|nr:WD repeat-containing protein 73 isoform X2 [Protopterus annectens]